MNISSETLIALADLACLESSKDETLAKDVGGILEFAALLKNVDTTSTLPLFHPLDKTQIFRRDEVTCFNVKNELAEVAPAFEDFYLVPKVIGEIE